MPNATFVLKQPKSKDATLVYLIFRYNGQKLKFSTAQKINPKYWNENKQRAKETKSFSGYPEFNALLGNIASAVNNYHRQCLNDKISPTPERLRNSLNEFLQKRKTGSKTDLIAFAAEIVANSQRKLSTKRQMNQTIRNLKEFKTYSKRTLHFETIDLDFYDDFLGFLFSKKYGTNTIGNFIKHLKVFMNEAVDRGFTTNIKFRNKKFKKMEEHSENIYLSIQEVDKLYKLNLIEKPSLDRVRDLFIIGCYTGLRFSDLVQLKNENLIDKKTKVKIKTEKTGELVIIPLHRYIKEILIKYNGMPPEIISNQKMNQYLKELGELAKIDETIMISSTKGGKALTETFKKHELITVHTARRSFATNAFLNDIPSISIMKITGHRTERAFMKYIKISQEVNANKLINHPFFN
jgi:integrase